MILNTLCKLLVESVVIMFKGVLFDAQDDFLYFSLIFCPYNKNYKRMFGYLLAECRLHPPPMAVYYDITGKKP